MSLRPAELPVKQKKDNMTLCSKCFSNFGLRKLADELSKSQQVIECNNCGLNGTNISTKIAHELMSTFFVSGSIPPEIGGPAPVYQYNESHFPGDINFETELDNDLKLLSNYLGVGLFHYGPPLWCIGATEHYNSLIINKISNDTRKKIWDEIINRCENKTIGRDVEIFRIRNGQKLPPALPEEFDSSPTKYRGEGRFHTTDFPIFYGALDIETCLHETRVTLADYSMSAVFKPCSNLKILNISENINDDDAATPFERVDILMQKLSYSGKSHYPLCQELAREIKNRGYDGFLSTSYFGQAHKKKLYNINLFGFPVKEKKIQLVSTNRINISSISYEYKYGPTNDTHQPLDLDKLDKLFTDMMDACVNRGEYDEKEVSKIYTQIKSLLNEKSNKPI